MKHSAIIVAAGKSMRFSKGGQNKTEMILKGKPVYYHSVKLFLGMGFEVILVTNEDVTIPGVIVTKGETERTGSVLNGLKHATGKYVFIHDAARPLISKKLVNKLLENIGKYEGFYLAKKIHDSLKKNDNGEIVSVNRDDYFVSETPQVFKRELLASAYYRSCQSYSDEVAMVQHVFPNIEIVPIFHNESNDKITVYEDFLRIKQLMRSKNRVGHSFDIHCLVEGRKLILGGIEIESEVGLLGHSDADVLLHAITKSILGALGLGDLGTNFPDDNPKYKDISSVTLLETTIAKMRESNYSISNIDIMLYLEKPKLVKYRDLILNNVIKLLDVDLDVVNFKVTTTEKIGPIGRNEAIAAEAYCLLEEVC